MKIRVLHTHHGCDTGCCGHIIEVDDDQNRDWSEHCQFELDHPGYKEDHLEYAKRFISEKFGAEHVVDLDWENSTVCDD